MDRKEFEQHIPRLRPLMIQVGRDFFGNKEDAEDVAQDSLERLWNYCERLDAKRNLEALAIMVAKNICVEKYKRRQNSTVHLRQTPEKIVNKVSDEVNQADAHLMSVEACGQIESAICTLSPREQQLVRKRFLEDLSTEEIALETGIPIPSVKSMLSMAKAKLKKRLRR